MAKLVIDDITSGYASTTAINTAFTAIETALENTLSRDGTSPNSMSANLDMNGYAILNQRATSGNENFIWEGTWATGTVYAVNNLVYAPEGTNEGATLICVTAHTAGATLDGDSAKWAVFAQRGASGAGTGDVIGPASSTTNSLARFSDTTGKLLKNGAVIGTDIQAYSANLAALSLLSTGTASGDIPLVGTKSATDALAGLVELSNATEAPDRTKADVVLTPATLRDALVAQNDAPIYACRAWINFDGTSGAIGSGSGSGNVSSVTDLGAGSYRVNFSTAMPDAAFCAVVSMGGAASATTNYSASVEAQLAGSVTVLFQRGDGTDTDATIVNVAVFR